MVEKPRLVGRERELAELARFLDAVPAGPVGLLFEGDAGIGKTTLWREAVLEALDRSYCVLSCRPVESEGQLAFTALGDLLEEVPDSATAELPVPQRRALEVALLQIDAEGPPPLPRAVSLGVLGVLRALAASGPLLIASMTSSGSTDRRRAPWSSPPGACVASRSASSSRAAGPRPTRRSHSTRRSRPRRSDVSSSGRSTVTR